MIREYVSKILNSRKNNITILFEDTVAFDANNFFMNKFHNLHASVKRIKQQARSKCKQQLEIRCLNSHEHRCRR